ncbi:MAG: Crp/Fnr family transcriptional regulator [Bacteroidota bacterium]
METSEIWYLENIDAQGIFCPQKLGDGDRGHHFNSYKKGDYIFQPGEAADNVYFVSSGRVKIGTDGSDEKSVTKVILGEGEVFGEKALTGETVRRDFAQALETTEICAMPKEQMNSMFREHSPLFLFMMKIIGNRAMEMERRLESLVFKDSRSRIIEFLVDLNAKKGQRVGYEWVVRKFITHQEIANLTATSRQTVTTVLNELKNKNLLTFNRKRLLIRDLDELKTQISPSG